MPEAKVFDDSGKVIHTEEVYDESIASAAIAAASAREQGAEPEKVIISDNDNPHDLSRMYDVSGPITTRIDRGEEDIEAGR